MSSNVSEEITLRAAHNTFQRLRLVLVTATGCVQLVGVAADGNVTPFAVLSPDDLEDLVDAAISIQIDIEAIR